MLLDIKKSFSQWGEAVGKRATSLLVLSTTAVTLLSGVTIHGMVNENAGAKAAGESDIYLLNYDALSGYSQTAAADIDPSHQVTVSADGQRVYLTTFGETVRSVLARAGVRIGKSDIVSPPLNAVSYDGMSISVTRVGDKTIEVRETVERPVTRRPSLYIDAGTEVVIEDGADGANLCVYSVSVDASGAEVSRRIQSTKELTPARERIVEYGTGGTVTTPGGEKLRYKRIVEVKATAYTTEGYRQKRTALGTVARVGAIAVDPRVIPLRSRVYVESPDGGSAWSYGVAVCEDTGGVIKGNIVDLFYNTRKECFNFGVKKAIVYVLE